MRRVFKGAMFFGMILFVAILPSGCMVREVRFDSLENSIQKRTADMIEKNVGGYVQDLDRRMQTKEERIVNIENNVASINGVTSASVVILENAAIVSINIDEQIETSMMTALRRNVERKVKEVDRSIKYVSVTATPEMIEKLHEIEGGVYGVKGYRGESVTNLRPPV